MSVSRKSTKPPATFAYVTDPSSPSTIVRVGLVVQVSESSRIGLFTDKTVHCFSFPTVSLAHELSQPDRTARYDWRGPCNSTFAEDMGSFVHRINPDPKFDQKAKQLQNDFKRFVSGGSRWETNSSYQYMRNFTEHLKKSNKQLPQRLILVNDSETYGALRRIAAGPGSSRPTAKDQTYAEYDDPSSVAQS